jgi:hypothetical protein
MTHMRRSLLIFVSVSILGLLGWAIVRPVRSPLPPAPRYDWPSELWVECGPLVGDEQVYLRPGSPEHKFIRVNADLTLTGMVEVFWIDEMRPAHPIRNAVLRGADTGVVSMLETYRRSGNKVTAVGKEFERLVR